MRLKRHMVSALGAATAAGGMVLGLGAPAASAATFSCPKPGSTVTGTLIIPSGAICNLEGVTVKRGGVIAEPGSSFSALYSTIGGPVIVSGEAAGRLNGICSTSIGGSVTVSNLPASRLFGLGSDEFGCGGDMIAGSVSISNNAGPVEIFDTTVGGSLSVTGNTSSTYFTDDGSVGIEGNTIDGSLYCANNALPPANDDLPDSANHVNGVESGQCAGLDTTPTSPPA